MGFEIDSNKTRQKEQKGHFDLHRSGASYDSKSSSAVDFHSWAPTQSEAEKSKTSQFLTLSASIHAAALLVISMMTIPLIEKAKTETITIEIQDSGSANQAPLGALVPATQGGTQAKTETPVVKSENETGGPDDIVVAKPKTKRSPVKLKVAKTATKAKPAAAVKAAAAVKVAAPAKAIVPRAPVQPLPVTIDDIDAPELEEQNFKEALKPATIDQDFKSDFAKVDRKNKALVAAEKKSMDELAAALAAEQTTELDSIDKMNKAEANKFAALQNSLRQKNAAAIASAMAAERAAALASARRADLKKGGLGGIANGTGAKVGLGTSNSGSNSAGTQVAGLPKGIRSLEQLKQMPGNPRPQYAREERRRGDQGMVAFVAYISKEGYPTQFRMIKSTGFASLDAKTLEALKKWRFQPGQEGWAELPFKWDLKGTAQEDGGGLRTSLGAN